MITEFCMSCGAKFQYSLKKPNFCSSCGTSMGEGESVIAEPPSASNASVPEANINSVPNINISKLEYEIDSGPRNLTIGDIIAQGSNSPNKGSPQKISRTAPSYNPDEDILKSTMKECSSSKQPDDLQELSGEG
jgi:hypothetical protein